MLAGLRSHAVGQTVARRARTGLDSSTRITSMLAKRMRWTRRDFASYVVSTVNNMQRLFGDSCGACCLGCLSQAWVVFRRLAYSAPLTFAQSFCLILQSSCPASLQVIIFERGDLVFDSRLQQRARPQPWTVHNFELVNFQGLNTMSPGKCLCKNRCLLLWSPYSKCSQILFGCRMPAKLQHTFFGQSMNIQDTIDAKP